MAQETIDTEMVDENNCVQKENDSKKALAWIIMALAVAYGLSPIDIIPDIPVVGWIDDFMINIAAFANLIQQQFCQTNTALNKLFNIIKSIFVCIIIVMFLLTILLILLIAKK